MTVFNTRTDETVDEWITPKYITDALGPFDLDPCAALEQPWEHAKNRYTVLDDGLQSIWFGRVFMNPPYGDQTQRWMKKLAEYKNGLALIVPRCGTAWFHEEVWDKAHSVFFFRGRISFCDITGKPRKGNNGDSCVVSYDKENTAWIARAQELYPKIIKGRLQIL